VSKIRNIRGIGEIGVKLLAFLKIIGIHGPVALFPGKWLDYS